MRWRALFFGLVALITAACGDAELERRPPSDEPTGGKSGAGGAEMRCGGGHEAGGKGGHALGGAPTSGAGGRGAGGTPTGGASSGGAAAMGGSGGATSGGATSGGSGGSREIPSRCDEFVDRSDSSASRTIEWGFGIGFSPERCMQVRKGQSVRLQGDFRAHPLGPGGGDEPNPFSGLPDPVAGAQTIAFPGVGVFGFECGIHATMSGAILVVE